MPWRETSQELERVKFITALETSEANFSELCRQFGISRETGYTWKRRFEEQGVVGLADRPPLAHHHPNATAKAVEDRVVAVRKQHPTWGPKKVQAWLLANEPELQVPAASTVGDILKRRGLTAARKRRLRVPPGRVHLEAATCPNALWTTDHKGSFRLLSGRCHPLTVNDAFSRFSLKCEALTNTSEEAAWPHYEAAFREYGLPYRMRSDNGVPFATAHALGRLSRLSVWWVKLGIELERIEPGHPEQNGAHERLHRTLEEAIEQDTYDLAEQQRRFDAFRRVYNHERPHEALGMRTPASVYETSWRPYPAVLPESPAYHCEQTPRRVGPAGKLVWKGREFFLSKVLTGEVVALSELDDGRWRLQFGPVFLAVLDLRTVEGRLSFEEPIGPHA
jgi:putative transposase